MKNNFKSLSVEDFNLTPEDLGTIVDGAQMYFPPLDEEGEPIDKSPEKNTS